MSPQKAAIDLRSVFGQNQAYVMLGRVQKLAQLFIIGSLPVNKITTGTLDCRKYPSDSNFSIFWPEED